MGIRIDGNTDLINAADGSLTIEGLSINTTGIVTASGGFKVGAAYTVRSNGNVETVGVITATKFSGDGSDLTGVAAGVWTETAVGVSTIKTAGINTTGLKGTAAGAATSEGAVQAHGNVSVFDGFIMTDKQIDKNLTLPSDKNAILIGPVTIATGIGITIESGATLLIA